MSPLNWLRGRKKIASATILALLIATPVTIAVLHPGFPISAVDLTSKDVWVTNSHTATAGRVNMQIAELNGATTLPSAKFDVLQSGRNVFVFDQQNSNVERVDPAYLKTGETISVPQGAEVTYGGSLMTVLDPSDGSLWIVPAEGQLHFDFHAVKPLISLGKNAHAVATLGGVVFAVAPEKKALFRIDAPGAAPVKAASVDLSDYSLSAVGDHAVILDRTKNIIIKDDGGTVQNLPAAALRIQQTGPAQDFVVVATGNSLLKVSFAGQVQVIDGHVSIPATNDTQVSAPVMLGACIHGAWASGKRYLEACSGTDPVVVDIPKVGSSDSLEFRVNLGSIVLNNITTGNAWLVTQDMKLADNWSEVTPPPANNGNKTDSKTVKQTFEDTIAQRTDQNHPPIARDDNFGVRPGKTTILPVLDNDTDPDGDVLTITKVSDVSAASGVVQLVDSGRALQFVPAPGASGTVSFRYTVSDGRPGGVAEAQVNVAIRPLDQNLPPVATRSSGVTVETGQTVNYNVLTDWIDPDGDDLIVTAASPSTSDIVRFRPDGQITFTNTSSELGQKTVTFSVSDGTGAGVEGQLIVDVKAAGELNPVGTPDYASTFMGKPVEISPLANDRSPSGAPLTLVSVKTLTVGVTPTLNLDRGTITANAGIAATYYLEYTLAAGPKTSVGIVRVDVLENPSQPLPPVAVTDTAYVRPNEPTSLSALANDQSPSGRVIGIQSITVPAEAERLSIAILNSSVLRITAPSGMTKAVHFTYTISDGLSSSTAGVTVVPVPELTKHQAPIAVDDLIKVRVGDVASVAVLQNDYHPDGARMFLDSTLVQSNVGTDGLAFVTGDQVRIQAPTAPGQYSITYRIYDAFNESAVARVVFTVLAKDAENNAAPLPRPLTARVFLGGSVTVEVPLTGIDPDGDSVVFVSASGASKGEISGQSSTAFTYKAYADAASVGTDAFTYQVRDALGKTATGRIQIGVLPRAETVLPPKAVDDAVSIRPGRTASIAVMANDSDPNGYPISIVPKLLEVQAGITAKVDNEAVVVEAGTAEGSFALRYQITNGKGGTSDAFVIVHVAKDALLQPPVAIDHVVEVKDIVGQKTVDVKVLDGAQNPGGLISDLVATVEGPNANVAALQPGGIVQVTLGTSREAVAYRLTNPVDSLSAMAFIIVPAYTPNLPPVVKPSVVQNPPVLSQNETREWKLTDLLDVPSGRQVRIINPEAATAGRSNGDPIVKDQFTLRYTPEKGFRGQVQLTFQVTDGDSATDTSGNQALITLPITVGDPNFEDVAPTFSNRTVSIQAGEAATTVDLLAASSQPNPSILSQLTYAGLTGTTPGVTANLSGSTLSVAAPFGTQPGATATLHFTVNYKDFHVPAQVDVKVVASTRPLPQAVDDVEPEGRPSSTYVLLPLANDFNPFAAENKDLKIVSADFEGVNLGATLAFTPSSVTVHTSSTKSGTISVIYAIRDATDTAARQVQGRITVVVASAPEPVTSFAVSNPGSQTVSVVFQPPSSSNGATITGYTVQIAGGPSTDSRTDCVPGANCTFTGRQNGSTQTVTVAATNRVGTTPSSGQSITPYGTPSVPAGPVLSTNSSTAPATITPQWSAPADNGGGAITYEWNFTQGSSASGSTGGTSGNGQSVGAGDYTFQVRACNPGGCSGYVSAARHINPTPPSATMLFGSDTGVVIGCNGGKCRHLKFTVYNIPTGNYTVQCLQMDGSFQTQASVALSSGTTVELSCFLGANYPRAGATASVYISGGSITAFYSDTKSWNW